MLTVFVCRERGLDETRVAATPDTVKRMVKEGLAVVVEAGAGLGSHITDRRYEEAGARIAADARDEVRKADVILKVAPLGPNEALGGDEAAILKEGAVVISFLVPHLNLSMVRQLRAGKITSLAMELVPRISRAQRMDALSSQASIAGYKAVLLAATHLDTGLPLMMTAAGTLHAARFVVFGAGVAGLQAVATAHRLGALVEVSDIRPAVKEQVASLGGKFIELPGMEGGEGTGGYAKEMSADFLRKQRELLAARVAAADAVITTALIPGKPAPRLVSREMVEGMRPGSVLVDLAVEQGGNCELSVPGRIVEHQGVTLIGLRNLPGTVPADASAMYARNVVEVVSLVARKGELVLDVEDEVIRGMLLTHGGEVLHGPTAEMLKAGAA